MTKSQTSVYLRDEQIEMISTLSRESRDREDVPELSKSEVHRRLLDAGIESDPELADLIPEHRRILHQRERFIDGEVKLQRLRTGFEGRCKQTILKRFKQGIRVDELDRLRTGLKQDAVILWPDDEDRRTEAMAYVDAWIDATKDAIETSSYDPLDPDTVLQQIGSIEREIEQQEREDSGDLDRVRAEIRERLGKVGSTDALADALSKLFDVDRDLVEDEIEQIRDEMDVGPKPISVSGSAPDPTEIEQQTD